MVSAPSLRPVVDGLCLMMVDDCLVEMIIMRVQSAIKKKEIKFSIRNTHDSPASKSVESERTKSGNTLPSIVSALSLNPVVDSPCLIRGDDG